MYTQQNGVFFQRKILRRATVVRTGAEALAEAMFERKRLAELPESVRPRTFEEAYQCQQSVVENWLQHFGGNTIGYKIACTNEVAQRQLRVQVPFTGRLL